MMKGKWLENFMNKLLKEMKNNKDSLAKTNNNLLKQVAEHLFELRKQNKEDNQIKYRLVWRKYDDVLYKLLKMTDIFCMQVADNKILRAKNEYILKELRNYVPEHHLFVEDNKEDKESEEPESKQMEFDFGPDEQTKH